MKIQILCHYRSSNIINKNTDIKVVVGDILRIICMQGECINIFFKWFNLALRFLMPTEYNYLKK